jgi:anti-sigma regulatory factor (Ser/Thr protein kinase)
MHAKAVDKVGGKLDFPKKANIIAILGEVYEDIRDALAEFVKNSIDAKARNIQIFLYRGKKSKIIVSDDGCGIGKEDFDRIPVHIGDSIKALDPGTKGEKGIGILGYRAFADKLELISRGRESCDTHKLILNACVPEDYEVVKLASPRTLPGTDAILYNIKSSRLFAQKSLVSWLKNKFRLDLAEEKFKIEVIERGKKIIVSPEYYKGVPFYISELVTKYGKIKINLYISPTAKTLKIGVAHKGDLTLKDICEMPEFECKPWFLGKVQGEITCDFCKQTSGRGGFIRDSKKFPLWVERVKTIEEPLDKEIKRLEEEHRRIVDSRIYKRLNGAFAKALKEFEALDLASPKVVHPEGEEIEGEMGDISIPKGVKGKVKVSTGKRTIKRGASIIKALSGRGFNWDETEFLDAPHLHSRFHEATQTIEINVLHKDYELEAKNKDEESKTRYLAKLGSKEIILHQYSEASSREQFEKMIQLELCVLRYV